MNRYASEALHVIRTLGPFRLALLVTLAFLVAAVGSMVVVYQSVASGFVPPETVGVNQPSAGARILDRNGNLLFQYVDSDAGVRSPVALDSISPDFIAATISTEDSTFFENPGVNFKGMARAAWENTSPLGEPLQGSGGSSLTQQLVKNVYFSPDERVARSMDRKLKEIIYASELTRRYQKDQILTWYLNEVSYGGLFHGVEAASMGYFGKHAKDLTLAEAALVAGIPQSPAAYDPFLNPDAAVARRNEVLDLLAAHASVEVADEVFYHPDLAAIEEARQTPLVLRPPETKTLEAPHFVLSYLRPELEARFGEEALLHDGLIITTTIDLPLQKAAEGILERWIGEFEATSNTHNGAVTVIDPRTGQILVMAGSRDYNRDDIEGKNNNLTAFNSPGSVLKPFVYLSLFLKKGSGPGFPIDDSPISFKQPDGSTFTPRNPNGSFSGIVSIRQALGNSLNIPAFKAANEVGVSEFIDFARSAGLTGLDGSYGPAIAIGGVDVRPLDVAYAYSALANGGALRGYTPAVPHEQGERDIDPVSLLKVERSDGTVLFDATTAQTERRIAPEEHVFLVDSILRDPQATCKTFGCGGLTVPGYDVAVKTGTSEPFTQESLNAGKIGETWAAGFTPDVTVLVWAGNSNNEPITNITSTSIAFRAMRDLMLKYYSGQPQTPFTQPPGVVRLQGCFAGTSLCVDDYFLRSSISGLETRVPEQPAPPPSQPANREPPPAVQRQPDAPTAADQEQQQKILEAQRKAQEEQKKKAEEAQRKRN